MDNYIAWAWKAGGNKNTFNVDDVGYATCCCGRINCWNYHSNGASSIGTKQGFSIIKYTGTGSAGDPASWTHTSTRIRALSKMR